MTETKAERLARHRVKMVMKKAARAHVKPRGYRVLANVSRNHPDYGLTPQQQFREHLARKTQRLS